ncbi:hypothetical protein BJY04DRAFT_195086 [Aspergillus karnatakaensis]|uniref:uncharacterized protein n=1 Tax=Aspergillus karnatakaensis TaxID=1810916 RepID=UPI003CCCDE1D
MDRLPIELLHCIGQHLFQDSSFRLMLTSRTLYHVILPLMYSDIFLRQTNLTAKKLSSLLHTLTQKPQLAHSLRVFRIEGWDTREPPEGDKPTCTNPEFTFDEALITRLVQAITKTPDEENKWLVSLRNGNPDAWLALLIPQLTNLRRLDVEYPYFPVYFNTLLQKAARGEVPAFQKLEETCISWADTELGIDSDELLPYFYFPAMRKLHAVNIVEREGNAQNGRFSDAKVAFSGIEEITLESSNCADGMTRWLQCCKGLKSFSVVHGGAIVSEDYWMSASFGKSLQRHKSTLEYLSLDVEDSSDVEEEQWVGSLAGYSALKYLHMRYPDLVGMSEDWEPLHEISELVPASLETLSIEGCGEDVLHWLPAQLVRLVESGRTPNLVTLSLEGFYVGTRDDCQPELLPLLDVCEANGVRVQ